MSMPQPESIRWTLDFAGFQWSKGNIYVPTGRADPIIQKISKADERLDKPFAGQHQEPCAGGIFAVDPEHIFVLAEASCVCRVPLPICVPVKIERSTTEMVDVDVKDRELLTQIQATCDIEGLLVGTGHIVMTHHLSNIRHLLDTGRVHLAGIRAAGMYAIAPEQNTALDRVVEFLNVEWRKTLFHSILFGTDETRRDALTAVVHHYVEQDRKATVN